MKNCAILVGALAGLAMFAGTTPAIAGDITFTVASLKVMPALGDKAGNYARFEALARTAAARGAHLIVTPEGYLDGYAGGGRCCFRQR